MEGAGTCVSLREQPQFLDTLVLWLHNEWLKQRPSRDQNPAEAYAKRRIQLQEHLGAQAIPLTLVACQQGQPVGCVSLTRLASRNTAFARGLWLSNLFVMPSARGVGVGSALAQAAERQACILGEPELFLFTASAGRFYERQGWLRCLATTAVASSKPASVSVFKKILF